MVHLDCPAFARALFSHAPTAASRSASISEQCHARSALLWQHQADNKPFTNPRAKVLMRHDNVIGTMDENTSRTE